MTGESPPERALAVMGDPGRFREVLYARARLAGVVRGFFGRHEYLEVETPLRIPRPALEDHIDAEPVGDAWLRTSPEFHMKRLVAAGFGRIFQWGACFRRGERGSLHHPEYTMLEWYRAHTDYLGILDETRCLLIEAAHALTGSGRIAFRGETLDMEGPWECLTVREAFKRAAGWDPMQPHDPARFDLDLVECVEPWLPRDRPVVLMDYPLVYGALARRKPGQAGVAERWELYLGGIELANAYSELTDADEQRERLEQCARARRARGQDVYEIDEAFLRALPSLPPTGGNALGVDRLLMILCARESLDDILPFRDG